MYRSWTIFDRSPRISRKTMMRRAKMGAYREFEWGNTMNKTVEGFLPVVEFLGTVLGKNSEIVLHDFSDLNHSVVAICNGEVSGRSIGAPATDFALKVLSGEAFKGENHTTPYLSHSVSGKPLHSSSLFIREEGEIVGMLCVNTDTSLIDNLHSVVSAIVGTYPTIISAPVDASNGEHGESSVEHFTTSADELVVKTVHNLAAAAGKPVDSFTPAERTDVIRRLNADGVFLLKGAVATVADALGISEPSVYRYLQKVRKEN